MNWVVPIAHEYYARLRELKVTNGHSRTRLPGAISWTRVPQDTNRVPQMNAEGQQGLDSDVKLWALDEVEGAIRGIKNRTAPGPKYSSAV